MTTTETQEQQTMPPPQKEHEWLQKLVGEWTVEGEMMEPGQPPQRWSGTESVRSLGGYWAVAESKSDNMMPGGRSEAIFCYGYDPRKGKYVSTFIGSMMADLWVSEGSLNADGTVLALDSDGPRMDGGPGTSRYRDVTEFKSDDHRVVTSYVMDDEGEWQQIMRSEYRKRGS